MSTSSALYLDFRMLSIWFKLDLLGIFNYLYFLLASSSLYPYSASDLRKFKGNDSIGHEYNLSLLVSFPKSTPLNMAPNTLARFEI